ncbi:MAG: MFS transporter [Bdellovibrionales bacterium]|nr:MFS transporter [Bdellovibrionales bacterium]
MLVESFQKFLPILILLLVIAFVLSRLPKVNVGHSDAFKKRRTWNWLPLGLTYAFLYMGRYNLTVAKNAFGDLMPVSAFGTIFATGTIVYGFSFILNGPLTDRLGGRWAILVSALGAAVCNFAMGLVTYFGWHENLVLTFSILYALNMYFQSFGAVAIVKVNSSWFHVRERGTFGGIFGILISLGLYFAYDWGGMIVKIFPLQYVFFIPTLLLIGFFILSYLMVRDTPSEAGFQDFETGEAQLTDPGKPMKALQVAAIMFKNPIILTIALVEFCSGYLRNTIMQFYIIFAKQTGIMGTFVPQNWGLLLCCAGILGGVFAGTISDKIFNSRRGPVTAVLYGIMLVGGVFMTFMLTSEYLGWLVVIMSMAIIGVHGMLSGTASMDFGGKRNVGTAVGIIDGFVYLGSALEAIYYGHFLPSGDAGKDPSNWTIWPVSLIPIAAIGFFLTLRLWNAHPSKNSTSKPETKIPVTLTAEQARQ